MLPGCHTREMYGLLPGSRGITSGWMFCSSENGPGMARNDSQRLIKRRVDRSIAGLYLKAGPEPIGNRISLVKRLKLIKTIQCKAIRLELPACCL